MLARLSSPPLRSLPLLTTEGLTGRPPRPEDWRKLARIWTDPEAAQWLSTDGAVWPREKIRATTARLVAHWRAHGFGPYLWFENGRFAGYAGLKYAQIDGEPVVEALWGVTPAKWGRGIATRAAEAALQEARDFGFQQVAAYTLTGNIASRRVMEKLGFVYRRDVDHAGAPHALYHKVMR